MNKYENEDILFPKKNPAEFIYKPPKCNSSKAIDATMGVKFAVRRVILDDYWLFGGTSWSRTVFRLKHPVIYSRRGLKTIWRRIKRLFIKPKTEQPLANHPHAPKNRRRGNE